MREFIKNPKFRNPYFWISIIGLFFSAAGIEFNTLTSWHLLGEALLSIANNPVSVVAVITALIGIYNNNDTKGLDPIKPKHEEANNE
jgi:uncharacterized membrane protein